MTAIVWALIGAAAMWAFGPIRVIHHEPVCIVCDAELVEEEDGT